MRHVLTKSLCFSFSQKQFKLKRSNDKCGSTEILSLTVIITQATHMQISSAAQKMPL